MWPKAPDTGYCWAILFALSSYSILNVDFFATSGVFFNEYRSRFKGSAALTSWVYTSRMLTMVITGLVFDTIWKKLDPRKMLFLHLFLLLIGCVSTMFITEIYIVIITYGLIAGFGFTLTNVLCYRVLAAVFIERRGFSFGIVLAGQSIGSTAWPMLMQYLFNSYGWHGAILLAYGIHLHALPLAILIPSGWPVENATTTTSQKAETVTPQQQENKDTGKANEANTNILEIDSSNKTERKVHRPASTKSHTFCDLITNWPFLIQMTSVMFYTYGHMTGFAYIPALSMERGFSKFEASILVACLPVTSIVGRPLFGCLADHHFWKQRQRILLGITNIFAALCFAILTFCSTFYTMMVVILLLGLAASGSIVSIPGSVLNIIGPQALSLLGVAFGAGFFIGIMCGGVILEAMGTCIWVIVVAAALVFTAGLLSLANVKG